MGPLISRLLMEKIPKKLVQLNVGRERKVRLVKIDCHHDIPLVTVPKQEIVPVYSWEKERKVKRRAKNDDEYGDKKLSPGVARTDYQNS